MANKESRSNYFRDQVPVVPQGILKRGKNKFFYYLRKVNKPIQNAVVMRPDRAVKNATHDYIVPNQVIAEALTRTREINSVGTDTEALEMFHDTPLSLRTHDKMTVVQEGDDGRILKLHTKLGHVQTRTQECKIYTTDDVCVQTDTINMETQPEPYDDQDKMTIPNRKFINKLYKNKKSFTTYSRLYYHLKLKYHLKHRDHQLINQLVHEARTWMIKEKRTCDTQNDYTIMSSAVLSAFLVSDEELIFRQQIKERTQLDNMNHLNKTVTGDMGKISPLKKPAQHSLLGNFLPNVNFVAPKINI